MPSVTFFTTLASVTNMHPGDVVHFLWHKPPNNRVIVFDLDPFLIDTGPGSWAQGEVTEVWRFITQDPHEQQVHVRVKNTGGLNMNCDIHMAQIGP